MLFTNGHIEFCTVSGGGIDPVSRYPEEVKIVWGDPVPCQWRSPKMALNARTQDGSAFKDVSYEILVEWTDISSERLRLYGDGGKLIGEFHVIRITPLREVSKVKIWV